MSPRKAHNGMGSARQRPDGRWEVRATIEGVQRSFYGPTLADAQAEAEKGRKRRVRDWRGITVRDWLAEWLEGSKQRLKPQTWLAYESHGRLHITPTIGAVRLDGLTPAHVDRLHAHLLRNVSGTMAHHVHMTLSAALNAAEKRGLPVRNVTRTMAAPRRTDREITVLTPEQVDKLLKGMRGDPFEAVYVLAVTVGMRLGEILGLQWKHVDLANRRLTVVNNAGKSLDGGATLGTPKTRSSGRRVGLPTIAIDALARTPRTGDLIWSTRAGKPILAQSLHGRWVRQRKALGLPAVGFHALRHTAATQLLDDGVQPHIVATMLGHSSVATTLRLYAHATRPSLDAALDAIESRYGAKLRVIEDGESVP
jgi:integrase